jgi:hypothetical protein
MPEQQLSIRSTKARNLAHRLAKSHRRTVSQVVEIALEQFAESNQPSRAPKQESSEDFWSRIARMSREAEGPDVDLMTIINEHRKPHSPIKL